MKKRVLCLALSALLLSGCAGASETDSNVSIDVSGDASSKSESAEKISVPEEMIGRWYIVSSTSGVLPLNGIFDIYGDDTLAIGERTLTLQGHYANFDDAYLFTYGTIRFIVSYDESKKGLDWGYQNGESYDMGFASSEPLSDDYAYEGDTFPMEKINEYLSTSGSIRAMDSDLYRLKLFTSAFNEARCASVEIPETTLKKTVNYITDLIDDGFVFPSYGGSLNAGSFAIGYDQSKTYLLRIIFFSDSEEANIFVYNYDETLLPKGSVE